MKNEILIKKWYVWDLKYFVVDLWTEYQSIMFKNKIIVNKAKYITILIYDDKFLKVYNQKCGKK